MIYYLLRDASKHDNAPAFKHCQMRTLVQFENRCAGATLMTEQLQNRLFLVLVFFPPSHFAPLSS